jgi:hypothetical protein
MNEGMQWIGNTTSLTFTDTSVEPEIFYIYEVCAVNDYGAGKRAYCDLITSSPKITGAVIYDDGVPLVGAKVELDGNATVAMTDEEGRFELETSFGQHNLTVWVDEKAVFSQDVSVMIDHNELGNVTLAKVRAEELLPADHTLIIVAGVAMGAIVLVGGLLMIRKSRRQ